MGENRKGGGKEGRKMERDGEFQPIPATELNFLIGSMLRVSHLPS